MALTSWPGEMNSLTGRGERSRRCVRDGNGASRRDLGGAGQGEAVHWRRRHGVDDPAAGQPAAAAGSGPSLVPVGFLPGGPAAVKPERKREKFWLNIQRSHRERLGHDNAAATAAWEDEANA